MVSSKAAAAETLVRSRALEAEVKELQRKNFSLTKQVESSERSEKAVLEKLSAKETECCETSARLNAALRVALSLRRALLSLGLAVPVIFVVVWQWWRKRDRLR